MSKKYAGFGVVETLLILVIIGIVGFVGWRTYEVNKDTARQEAAQRAVNNVTKNTKLHTSREAVTFTQATYNKYLSAVMAGNEYNSSNPGPNNKTLPRYGLDAIKDSLRPDLYTKILSNEQTKGGDGVGCALFAVDHYVSSLSSDDSSIAVVNVGIRGSDNFDYGTISVKVDLADLKIASITCPNN